MPRIRIWDYEEIAKETLRREVRLEDGRLLLPATVSVPDGARREGETEAKYLLRLLLRDLQTLASEADILIRAYDPRVSAADDLVNDYDVHLELAKRAVEEGLITADMLDKARAVDAKIEEMGEQNGPTLWTNEGLRTRAEWVRVRSLAREALETMGYPLEPPPPGSM